MLKKTIRYLWGKKFILLILALVICLLPNILTRQLQVHRVPILTKLTISTDGEQITIAAQKLKVSPGAKSIDFDEVTYQGTNVRTMLKDVSLAHCTAIDFTDEPDVTILHDLYNYQDLRANTKVNHGQTIDEILKNQYYRCQ